MGLKCGDLVSTLLSSAKNNSPECLEPAEQEKPPPALLAYDRPAAGRGRRSPLFNQSRFRADGRQGKSNFFRPLENQREFREWATCSVSPSGASKSMMERLGCRESYGEPARRRVASGVILFKIAGMPFISGKNKTARFVVTPARDGRSATVRYYPQRNLAEFNAAILAELGEPPGTPMSKVFTRWTVTQEGWKRDR